MKFAAQRFASVSGLCVTIAILCSGCASGPTRPVANFDDLNYFVVDCGKKMEQMQFLQSLRRSADDQLFSFSGLMGHDKQTNWLINTNLIELSTRCR